MKHNLICPAVIATVVVGIMSCSGQTRRVATNEDVSLTTSYKNDAAGLEARFYLVSEGLTIETSAELARQSLARLTPGRVLYQEVYANDLHNLTVATAGTQELPEIGPPGFDETLRLLNQYGGIPGGAMARLFCLDGVCLLSFRDPRTANNQVGTYHEQMLTPGSDPTEFRVGGGTLRLLTCAGNSRVECFFQARSTTPSCDQAVQLTTKLSRLFPTQDVEVSIRTDTWFASPSFPLYFAFPGAEQSVGFRRPGSPPSVWEYYRAFSEVQSQSVAGVFKCTSYGARKEDPAILRNLRIPPKTITHSPPKAISRRQ